MKCNRTGRCILLTICILQMLSTAERQLFDFLGRIWLSILCNFFHFIFVIFGFFGAYQYKTKYIIVYMCWLVVWVAWNAFVICFYLNVGSLSNSDDWLNMGTGSASWWEVNGVGCSPVYPTNLTQLDVSRPLRPDVVAGCVLDYQYVETMHAALQCCFAVPGFIVSIYLIRIFCRRDENCKKKPASIYYVEYSSPREGSESPELAPRLSTSVSTAPMTPRKVKRHNRHRSSGKSQGRSTMNGRASTRSRRPKYLNPVTQLIDKANESTTSTESLRPPTYSSGRQGHSNPTYVHSRPVSTHVEHPERPPSVHSSYSNYHGQRPSLNPAGGFRNGGPSFQPSVVPMRSTFRPEPAPRDTLRSRTTTMSGDTSFSEADPPPPPYVYGVNSETVI